MITRRCRPTHLMLAVGVLSFGVLAGCSQATPQPVATTAPSEDTEAAPAPVEPAATEPVATEPAAPPVDAGPAAYQENGIWHVPVVGGAPVEIPLGQAAVLEYEDGLGTVEFTVTGARTVDEGLRGDRWTVETTQHIVAGDSWFFVPQMLRVSPAGTDLSCDTWVRGAGPTTEQGAASGVGNTYDFDVPYDAEVVGPGPHWVVFADGSDEICPVAYWVIP